MMRFLCLLVLIFVAFSVPAKAQTETVLYKFGSTPTDGYEPAAPLLIDASGDLFGTTSGGGTAILCPDPSGPNACGTVFELINSSGSYTESVLYNFIGAPSDGDEPTTGLIADSSGNLYGTTDYGGSGFCGATSCGTAFELVKSSTGYTENVIHTFTGFDGGGFIFAGLIMDSSGNLYGTADGAGANGYGNVFELVNSSGSYTEKVLYSFGATAADGWYPVAGLVMDAAGNLFGTTSEDGGPFSCGLSSCGTVFELVNSPTGYTEKVLYTFAESDGANPLAGLIMDSSGNLYGTTSNGGAYGFGTVFELVNSSGSYTERVLHSFGGTPADGVFPVASLLMDGSGNLFGTTKMGGSATLCDGLGCGTAFELVNSSGTYAERVLHSFGQVGDGESPAAALVMDKAGNLYGTTEAGGSSLSLGTVFEINPSAPGATPTTSTLGSNINPSPLGQAVTFGVIVTDPTSTAGNRPTGTAAFFDGAAQLGAPVELQLNLNTLPAASFTTSSLAVGSHSITAVYSGDANYSPSASNVVTQIVNATKSPTTTALVSSLNPSGLGDSITITASVTSTASGTPTGTATFFDGSTQLAPPFVLNAQSSVSFASASLSAGAHSITAQYGGDANFTASTSPVLTQQVNGPAPNYSVTANPTTVTISSPGQSGSTTLTFTSQNDFTSNGMVAIAPACSGLPSGASCSSTSSVTIAAGGSATAMVTFNTMAPSLIAPNSRQRPDPSRNSTTFTAAALACLFSMSVLAISYRRRQSRWTTAVLFVVGGLAAAMAGCGGGSGGGVQNPGTPPGTYPGVSVTVTINGVTQTLQNLTLNIQ
jgi:uncharacterized repeat protein (TIGR03803 family)